MTRLTVFFIFAILTAGYGQKYSSEKSFVSFFSKAAIEDITAENTKSTSLFNESTGEIVFVIPIKDFEFAKALMKEHFNEKYMDTEKFPKATFQGKVSGFDPKGTGEQKAVADGKLSIHGVTHDVAISGTMEFQNGKIVMKSKFIVKLADYAIAIPQLLWQNIAEQVEVKVEFTYKAL
jgi:polyisoprenoid-binding protein YceI